MRKIKNYIGKAEREIDALKNQVARLKKEKIKYARIKHDLGERVKELNCLYGISNVMEQVGYSLEQVLQEIVELIPSSWQYPEITTAKIDFDGKSYRSEGFKEGKWSQSSKIFVYGDDIGQVCVYYLKKRPDIEEGPFLKEERSLIDAIATRIGRYGERRIAEEKLFQKNVALKEIVAQIEIEKRGIKESVNANIDKLIFPLLKKIKKRGASSNQKYIQLLEKNLSDLTSDFASKIVNHSLKLTSREIEICNLIKNGFSMKEISKTLNISFYSVGTHRRNIRKKLGLVNQKINLPSFLKSNF